MAKTIILIRHAETNANRAGRWQGWADGGLSAQGEQQLLALAARQNGVPPDYLIASDLSRTLRTASVVGDPTPNSAWREFNVGEWEGLTTEEIAERFPGQMELFFGGEDVAPGGGEQMSAFAGRIVGAFEELVGMMDDGETAVVVTHGGAIWSVMGHILGLRDGPLKLIPSHNTASTTIRVEDDESLQLAVFNDASHLGSVPTQFGPDGTTVSLYRHGQTEGNVEGRWQGRTDSSLTALGRKQVEAAARFAPQFGALYTSPLGRTVETASILGRALDAPTVDDPGLIEMAFGSWENMTTTEAVAHDPELFDLIYSQGEDAPRGRDGESFGQAGDRVHEAIRAFATDSGHDHIGAVSHGAAIRAYVTSVLGLDFTERNRLPIPRNSSMSQVRQAAAGPVLAAYNVAPHLDD
ncbi:MAG: histidine phosphatase family protein [Actinomycetota bacterium]